MNSSSLWNGRALLALALASGGALSACGEASPSEEAEADEATFAAVLDDEARRYADDRTFFAARRAAFERIGAILTVPPSLSSNPIDPVPIVAVHHNPFGQVGSTDRVGYTSASTG